MTRVATTTNRRAFLAQSGLGALAFAVGCQPETKTSPGGDSAALDSGLDTGDTGAEAVDLWGPAPTDCADPTGGTGTGPFYREGAPLRTDLNVLGEEGDAIRIYFRVLDQNCTPIPNAFCEIWHCAPEAAYDMETDDMRFYGSQYTDAEGKGWFQTLKPPIYTDDAGQHINHIHVLITVTGFKVLAFQVQFSEDGMVEGAINEIADLVEAADGFREASLNFILTAETAGA